MSKSAVVMEPLKLSTNGRRRVEREQSATRAVVAAVLAGGLAFSVSLFPLPSDDTRLLDLLPPENEISEWFAPSGKATVGRLVAVAGAIELADLLKLTELVEGEPRDLPTYVLPTLVQSYGLPMVVHILELAKANSIPPEALPALGGASGGGGSGGPAVPANTPPDLLLLLQLLGGVFPHDVDADAWRWVAEALPGFGELVRALQSQLAMPATDPVTTMTQRSVPAPLPPPPTPSSAPVLSESASPPLFASPSLAPNTWSASSSSVVTITEPTHYMSVPLEPSAPSFTPTSIPASDTPELPGPSGSAPNTPGSTGAETGNGDETNEPSADPENDAIRDPEPDHHAGPTNDDDLGHEDGNDGDHSHENQSQDSPSNDTGSEPPSG
jgi:hypothetical protein